MEKSFAVWLLKTSLTVIVNVRILEEDGRISPSKNSRRGFRPSCSSRLRYYGLDSKIFFRAFSKNRHPESFIGFFPFEIEGNPIIFIEGRRLSPLPNEK